MRASNTSENVTDSTAQPSSGNLSSGRATRRLVCLRRSVRIIGTYDPTGFVSSATGGIAANDPWKVGVQRDFGSRTVWHSRSSGVGAKESPRTGFTHRHAGTAIVPAASRQRERRCVYGAGRRAVRADPPVRTSAIECQAERPAYGDDADR